MSSILPDIKFNHFLVMSNQNFVLSDQDGVLVGHLSFLKKKIICSHFQAPGRFSKSEIPSCIYMPVLAGERKGMQISRSALEVKEQRDGTVVRVLASHQGARVQIPASMPYVG